jgi:hypothetical protein
LFFGWQFLQQQEFSTKFHSYANKYTNGNFKVELTRVNYENGKENKMFLTLNHKNGKRSLLVDYDLNNYKVFGLFDGKISQSCEFIDNWICGSGTSILGIVPNDIVPAIEETETDKITSVTNETIAGQKSECFNFSDAYGHKGIFCFNSFGAITKIYLSNADETSWTKDTATKITNKADENALILPNN